ncbi:hypothetical protein [Pseudomonas tructae]|uniref:hypothetical protein n=1 Tax=Pseudomonas tructae TaxID=2518644 RepID=UPI0013EED39B|nr:hypothetical protein [Pseudomonas tructae]
MKFGRPSLLCLSFLLLQGCFDEPKHIDQETDRSKSSLQMQQPSTDEEKANERR